MADELLRDVASNRVAEAVRRAMLLVGPSEGGVVREGSEQPVEEPAV